MSDNAQKCAIIVDSSNIINRNFHAMKPHTGVMDDHPLDVGAIRGYMEYVAKKLYGPYSGLKFDLLVHALDSGGSDYRRQLLPSYKANRPPKHPALIAQEAMLMPALTAMGEHVLQRRGVEADDLIASLTNELVAAGYLVCIVTSDKDLMQLVKDGQVAVARYEKVGNSQFNEHVMYGEDDVFKKLNVYPSQVAAFLAMMGDTVDNIKGVFGIGKGKAAALLQEYGTFESLVTRADEIKGKLGENFRAAKDDGTLDLCYKLTCPVVDLQVDITPFTQSTLLNETDAAKWHKIMCLGNNIPLRLSVFDKEPGYAGQPVAEKVVSKAASVPATTPVAQPPAAPVPVAARAPAPVAPPAAPVADPFMSGGDPFGEGLDDAAAVMAQPFVSPPPRTAESVAAEDGTPAPEGRKRFVRRPG